MNCFMQKLNNFRIRNEIRRALFLAACSKTWWTMTWWNENIEMLSKHNRFIICSQYNHNLRLGLHLQKLPLHKPFRLSFIHCGLHQQMASAPAPAFEFLTKKTYTPPSWASHLHPLPSHVFSLAHVCMKNHITSPNHIKPILIFFSPN